MRACVAALLAGTHGVSLRKLHSQGCCGMVRACQFVKQARVTKQACAELTCCTHSLSSGDVVCCLAMSSIVQAEVRSGQALETDSWKHIRSTAEHGHAQTTPQPDKHPSMRMEAHHAALIVEAGVEVPEPLAPEGEGGLAQPGPQAALEQGLHVGMPPLPEHGPHILKVKASASTPVMSGKGFAASSAGESTQFV